MKKQFLATLALAAMLAAEGAITQATAMVVRTPPPRHRVSRAVGRPPRAGMVWTGGYYRWNRGRRGRGRYSWVPGRWVVPPRPGAVWVAPRWRRSRNGYTFVAGRWR